MVQLALVRLHAEGVEKMVRVIKIAIVVLLVVTLISILVAGLAASEPSSATPEAALRHVVSLYLY